MSRKNNQSINSKVKYKVSIVVVYYDKYKELLRCLSSLQKFPLKYKFEVIIVNNSLKEIKLLKTNLNMQVINSPSNLGYGAGNNLGVKNSSGEYILILNPDTEFIDSSMNKLIKFLDVNKKVGIVGPNLVHSNGVVFSQLGSRTLTPLRGIFALSILNKIFPNNLISKSYWLFDTRMDILREVDVVAGSGLLIRRRVFESVEGFDENFFLYFEESDLCKRIKDKYKSIKFFVNPDAQLIHYWKPKDPGTRESHKIFSKSRFYFFKKHYGIIWTLVVEFFANLSKYDIVLILMLLLVIILKIII